MSRTITVLFAVAAIGLLACDGDPIGSDPNAEFSYRIVAKRLGFEDKRLEPAPWVDNLAGDAR